MTHKLPFPHLTQVDDFTMAFISELLRRTSLRNTATTRESFWDLVNMSGDTLIKIIDDCSAFQEQAGDRLDGLSPEQVAKEFLLQRQKSFGLNREVLNDELKALARSFGPIYLYFDRQTSFIRHRTKE